MSEKKYIDIQKRMEQWGKLCDSYFPNLPCERLEDFILCAPAADVEEVRHGEWKQATEPCGWHDVDCVVCSACGESWILDGDFDFDVVKDFWNFCPACGAKMDGERKDKP